MFTLNKKFVLFLCVVIAISLVAIYITNDVVHANAPFATTTVHIDDPDGDGFAIGNDSVTTHLPAGQHLVHIEYSMVMDICQSAPTAEYRIRIYNNQNQLVVDNTTGICHDEGQNFLKFDIATAGQYTMFLDVVMVACPYGWVTVTVSIVKEFEFIPDSHSSFCLNHTQYVGILGSCSNPSEWRMFTAKPNGAAQDRVIIQNIATGKCLSWISSGNQIRLKSCGQSDTKQQFHVQVVGGQYQKLVFKNVHSNRYLGIGGYGGNRAHTVTNAATWNITSH